MTGIAARTGTGVDTQDRFGFGANWKKYLGRSGERQFAIAQQSLADAFGNVSTEGRSFLDVGCGSGIFSLAALRLGCRVTSFDYDPDSVQCALQLRESLEPEVAARWSVQRGSVLDPDFIDSLGRHELVYAWGVLHHTGNMVLAMDNAARAVADGGRLCVALYNDEGWKSRAWWLVKRIYNASPTWLRPVILALSAVRLWGPSILRGLVKGAPLRRWREYEKDRGMSPWRDIVDWVGGFPYEVASPDMVKDFYSTRGFVLERERLVGRGHGCNEFIFRRLALDPARATAVQRVGR